MDRRTFEAWRAGTAPFNMDAAHAEGLQVGEMREMLLYAMPLLRARYEFSKLYTQYDFHDRDGVLTPLEAASWHDLTFALQSEESVAAWAHEDPHVCRLWTTEDRLFVLRWAVRSDVPPPTGRFVCIGPDDVLSLLRLGVERETGVSLRLTSSHQLLMRNWRSVSASLEPSPQH